MYVFPIGILLMHVVQKLHATRELFPNGDVFVIPMYAML